MTLLTLGLGSVAVISLGASVALAEEGPTEQIHGTDDTRAREPLPRIVNEIGYHHVFSDEPAFAGEAVQLTFGMRTAGRQARLKVFWEAGLLAFMEGDGKMPRTYGSIGARVNRAWGDWSFDAQIHFLVGPRALLKDGGRIANVGFKLAPGLFYRLYSTHDGDSVALGLPITFTSFFAQSDDELSMTSSEGIGLTLRSTF